MSDEDMVPVNFKAPKDAYERAKDKLDFGEMSEELRGRVNEIAYGAETTRREELREKLSDLRDDKREIDNEIDGLESERSDVQRKIERVEQQLDEIRDTDGEYNGALEMLESQLHSGERIHTNHDGLNRAANIAEKPKKDVVADLRERNPGIPDCAFELSSPHEPIDWREVE